MASEVAGHGAACDFAAVLDADLGGGNADEGDGGDPPGLVDDRDDAGGDVEHAAAVGDAFPQKGPKENAKDRSVAINFASMPHLGSVCTSMRMICTSVFDLMHSHLDQGGARWEKLQYAKAYKGLPRQYRDTNAAQLKFERVASKGLFNLADDCSR